MPRKRCPSCLDRPPRPGGRYCSVCHATYMRAYRSDGSEAARVRERYQTDPDYRERRRQLARESMARLRARRAAAQEKTP